MINVELIQAAQGDCIWVEYGEDEDSLHRILIDGGTVDTFNYLKKRIKSLPSAKRNFELLVITHIDSDHISGILKLIEDTKLGVTFEDIWFNGYKHLGKTNIRGVTQAELISSYLSKPKMPWNKAFKGKAVYAKRRKKDSSIKLLGGMEITILSPTKKDLSKLKPQWAKEIEKAEFIAKKDINYTEELSVNTREYKNINHKILLDIDSLAKTPFTPDTSLTNGSSIAFIAEYKGKKMLFTGDAYATTLIKSLKRYLPNCEPLYLDLFKIPHHGSDGNITKELLERIRCSKYLISTNGAYHKHPDITAIAKIIKYGGNKPDIYFNYLSKYNIVWSNQILKEKYQYYTHYTSNNNLSINIHI